MNNQSIYKKPPRGETHKPVSVSKETHSRLMQRQLNMQYRLRRKVSLDEVIADILNGTEEPGGTEEASPT